MKIWIHYFYYRLSIIYPALSIFIIFTIAPPAKAVMPPEHYALKAEQSKIKAIAIIKKLEIINIGKQYSSKRVIFKREYALNKDTPKIFTGYCKSVETLEQNKNVMPGGDIFFYPHPGQRVFVTIYQNDGDITTMTPVTPELEKGIRKTPDKIRYIMDRAHIQGSRQDMAHKESIKSIQEKRVGKYPVHNTGNSELDKELKALEIFGMDVHGTPQEEIQGQLLLALGNDDVIEVHQLLKNGAEINKPFNSSGQTPLMAAESLAMAKLLCENGADTRLKDAKGGTVLHFAISRKSALEMIPYLVSHGANVNEKGWDNEPPIFAAVSYFNEMRSPYPKSPSAQKVIELLTDLGADLNAVDEYGNTVLIQCTVADNTDLVKLLLALGADAGRKNNSGKTARDIAYELGYTHLSQMLKPPM